jgi:hypothetical protein
MDKALWLSGGLLLLGLVVAYTQELPVMMNYLQVGAFWQTGLLIGFGLSVVSLVLLFFRPNVQSLPVVEKLQLSSTVLFIGLLLCPLFLSWTNRWGISAKQAQTVTVIFESEQARFTSRFGSPEGTAKKANQFLLFFFQNGQLRRVNGKRPFFPGAQSGDPIELEINDGRWGFQWLER